MSMPEFPNPDCILTREQSINAILTSIALEEAALSHIINAEGEKIQYVLQNIDLKNFYHDMDKILEVNESVSDLIEQITDMQLILKNKMRLAAKFLKHERTGTHDKPMTPCRPKRDIAI
jgi:hypothetical protein